MFTVFPMANSNSSLVSEQGVHPWTLQPWEIATTSGAASLLKIVMIFQCWDFQWEKGIGSLHGVKAKFAQLCINVWADELWRWKRCGEWRTDILSDIDLPLSETRMEDTDWLHPGKLAVGWTRWCLCIYLHEAKLVQLSLETDMRTQWCTWEMHWGWRTPFQRLDSSWSLGCGEFQLNHLLESSTIVVSSTQKTEWYI